MVKSVKPESNKLSTGINLFLTTLLTVMTVMTVMTVQPPSVLAEEKPENQRSFEKSLAELPENLRHVAKNAADSIAVVRSEENQCTGILVANDLIVTSWYCVNRLRDISISWLQPAERSFTGEAVAIDKRNNLVIIKIPSQQRRRPVPVYSSKNSLAVREKMVAIGLAGKYVCPINADGSSPSLAVVRAEVLREKEDGVAVLYPGGDAVPGSAVLTSKGELTGITTFRTLLSGSYTGTNRGYRPIRALLKEAAAKEPASFWHAEGDLNVDWRYMKDPLLNETTDTEGGTYVFGFSYDFYDRIRIGYSQLLAHPGRYRSAELGYQFSTRYVDFIPLIGINQYDGNGKEFQSSKYGMQIDISIFEFSVFSVEREDERHTVLSFGF